MVISHMSLSWEDLVISHMQQIHFNSSNLCGSIFENTGRAFGQRRKNSAGYCQSNCLNCWSSKVRTNTVHYIWNINNCTVKIFLVQLKCWNGPLFPAHMYVSTQNQKSDLLILRNKNNKVSGPVCCLIPRADTIHFFLKKRSTVDRPELLFIAEHHEACPCTN